MKTNQSKTTKVMSEAQEECGVWLDVAELRAKKQKKRLTRPISKLLNPLAQSGGYSMAVGLSFTQTKLHMPATKQSTISSFFPPQSKMNKDTEEHRTTCPSEMSVTPLQEGHTRIKRKRGMTFELSSEHSKDHSHTSQVHPQVSVDFKRETDEFCQDRERESPFFHLIWGCQSEELEPAEKRRRPEDITFENILDTQKEGNKAMLGCRTSDDIEQIPETLLHCDQVQQESCVHSTRIYRNIFSASRGGSSAYNSVKGFQSQESLKPFSHKTVFTTRSVTENKYTVKLPSEAHKQLQLHEKNHHYIQWSPVKTKAKENSRSMLPSQHIELLPIKQHSSTSPAKLSPDFKLKYRQSPKKSVKESLGYEADSLAMLFTQDSEGCRVIANRSKRIRCPLNDLTNSMEGLNYLNIQKLQEPEENSELEPELLFTQDSQGNMVIKH